MTELLSPAGGREALAAAVQNGADAVYMGFGSFNARRSARNFSEEEFLAAVRYCHLRTVDIGLPQLAMHSSWETAGVQDYEFLIRAMTEYFGSAL